MRVAISGSTAVVLGKISNGYSPRYSPDGNEIAVEESGDRHDILTVRDAKTGQLEKAFDVPEDISTPWGSNGVLRWTPDGRMLTCLFWRGVNTPANIWSQSLSGGPLKQITHFQDGIVAYDWSPDGKQLAYTRSAPTRDVVLISNFH